MTTKTLSHELMWNNFVRSLLSIALNLNLLMLLLIGFM